MITFLHKSHKLVYLKPSTLNTFMTTNEEAGDPYLYDMEHNTQYYLQSYN